MQPRTEAERRAAEVDARRGERRPKPEVADAAPDAGSQEWIDEGPVRDEAVSAVARAGQDSGPARPRRARKGGGPVDPTTTAEIERLVGAQRAARLTDRLGQAATALDGNRLDDARRIITPLARELPGVAAVRRISGFTAYRLGQWRKAVTELEAAHEFDPSPDDLPVIADAYRAQRRWERVDEVWDRIKSESPAHHVMAEGRIVAAGAKADQGELGAALKIMEPATRSPKRIREHHLRQWYVLGDLHDRAGDPIAAARFFGRVAERDEAFADVASRLAALGRR